MPSAPAQTATSPLSAALKPALSVACLLPFVLLIWRVVSGSIGPNPVQAITHDTGDWALRLLLATLAMTPLRRLTGWAWPVRLRRMLGLFAFFYAVLHFTTYLWLDQFFDWQAVVADIAKRPYITVGFAALLLMLPLAVTSTRGWQRRLGRNWKRLHRLVYGIGLLGVLHYLWLVKADLLEPAIYAGVLAVLLLARLPWSPTRKSAAAAISPSAPPPRRRSLAHRPSARHDRSAPSSRTARTS